MVQLPKIIITKNHRNKLRINQPYHINVSIKYLISTV